MKLINNTLKYKAGRNSQNKVKNEFLKWRKMQPTPWQERCDNPSCYFHTNLCIWNGKELHLILDHKNGVSGDNRPENLQLLCPNCNSQQPTHGGGNKGRVEQSSGGFSIKNSEGKRNYFLPIEAGKFEYSGGESILTKKPNT